MSCLNGVNCHSDFTRRAQMLMKTCFLLLAGGALVFAQHGESPSVAEAGGQIFQSTCSRCHGPDGDGVPPINLLRGKFRKTYSDTDLVKIIQGGISGTSMPPGNYTDVQAKNVVAYFHASAEAAASNAAPPGDPARGKDRRCRDQGRMPQLPPRQRRRLARRPGSSLTSARSP